MIARMEQNGSSQGSFTSMLIGFVAALSNHFFGWFNTVFLKISIDININEWFQALMTGMIGATGAYFANRFWKLLDRKKKKHGT